MKVFKKAMALLLACTMIVQPLSVSAATTTTSKPSDGTTTKEPFTKGTAGSNSFRIPSLVTLSDGTLVAAADARWDTTYDGGGLDTIVSRSSDNGANWNYTFANYLGDNGNTYNGSSSTCFIDPAMAVTSDDTIYMLVDLYPYGVALNGSGNTAPSTKMGFDSKGRLILSNDNHSSYGYYLENGKIYSTSGTEVSGYTVDDHFNITSTDGTIDSNLFFSDSPYKVVRTGYLYLTTSTDNGATWSAPTLLNLKTSSEQVCLVGPGRGLVTKSGTIVFPVYSYNGLQDTQKMSFVYSTDGSTWERSSSFTGATWSSESAVVELTDGTLRFFYRNGTKNLCYVDYSNGAWGSAVNTGVVTNSNCQISAITYSKTVGGKQVIFVSCPTGPNEAGSDQSSADYRKNGKIFVGLVNDDKTIDWQNDAKISVPSVHSTDSFMYSCLTELSDGSIAILYEDNESGWGTGSDKYYQMSYATYEASELGLTFDEANADSDSSDEEDAETPDTPSDDSTLIDMPEEYNGVISSRTTEGESYWQLVTNGVSGITSGKKYLIASGNSGSVYLLGYTEGTSSSTTVTNSVISSVSEDNQFTLTGSGNMWTIQDKNGTYLYPTATRTLVGAPGGNVQWKYSIAYTQSTASNVTISGSSSVTISCTVTSGNNSTISYIQYGKSNQPNSTNSFRASNSSSALYLFEEVTVAGTTYYTVDTTGLEKLIAEVPTAQGNYTDETWEVFQNALADANEEISSTAESYDTESAASNQQTNINDAAFMLYKTWQELKEYKTIEITVNYKLDNDTVKTETISVLENATKVSLSKVITSDDGEMYSVENTELSLNNAQTTYDVAVTKLEGYPVTVSQGSTLTVSPADPYGDGTVAGIELKDGQYVKWTSADSSYVGVAGVYNTSTNTYSDEADIFGQQVTTTPVVVIGTIYNANGTVDSVCQWIVTVTEAAAGTTSVSRYFDVDQVEHCTLYYSVNGGELVQVNGTGVSIIPSTDSPYKVVDGTWYGNLSLIFFAAPDEGYALTHMYVETSDNQYYVLSDGNGDVKNSSAWPLLSTANTDALYTSGGVTYSLDMIASRYLGGKKDIYELVKNDTSTWKSGHGFRWALLEGYVTVGRLEELYNDALELGCTGVTTVTRDKNATEKCGIKTNPVSICAVAQKLPTIEKSITSSTSSVDIGDSIDYKIEVTVPKTDAVVKYWNENTLVTGETSTISYTNMSVVDSLVANIGWNTTSATSSTENDQTSTVTYSLTLTTSNFKDIVKDGKIVNTATLNYAYKATYGSGNYSANDFTEASVTVVLPSYVVDFGLPVTIDLSSISNTYGEIKSISLDEEKEHYGTVSWDSYEKNLTYTATQALQDVEYVEIDLEEGDYAIAIYPATTVYYEEYFAKGVSGDWSAISSNTTTKLSQTAEEAGKKRNVYGYDDAYTTEEVGVSNGTSATSENASVATFTFTGTGVDIYTNNTIDSGILMAWVKDSNGKTVKVIQVDTHMENGDGNYTQEQEVSAYNVPVVSLTGLTRATYTVELRHIGQRVTDENGITKVAYKTVSLDGFRVHGTIDYATDAYVTDKENNPTFVELRDRVLAGLEVNETSSIYAEDIAADTLAQVYATAESTNGAVVLSSYKKVENTNDNIQDLLDNGPKNELYLCPGESVVFKVKTNNAVQIGLKALNEKVSYSIDNGDTVKLTTSTDMFYSLAVKKDEVTEATYTITNKSTSNNAILSITELKLCGAETTATQEVEFEALTEEDLMPALLSLGFESEATYADASLAISVNDGEGNVLATTALTENGVVGESATFIEATIQAAVEALELPENYKLENVEYADVEVAYGESDSISFTATEEVVEPEEPDDSTSGNTGSFIDKIFDAFKNFFNGLWK